MAGKEDAMGKAQKVKYVIKREPWDDGDWIVTVNGHPMGQPVSCGDAMRIVRWLQTAVNSIIAYGRDCERLGCDESERERRA